MTRKGQFEKEKAFNVDDVKKIVEIGADAAKVAGQSLRPFEDDGATLGLPIYSDND